jgi:hypothetical protein
MKKRVILSLSAKISKISMFTLFFLFNRAYSVSMNFSGMVRTEGDYYNNLGLGLPVNPTKAFFGMRALVQPDLVIDDHFSFRSQWNLLTSPNLTPAANVPLGVGQGGYILGDTTTAALVLNRAWLEWVSDLGQLRAGRMPVSWGYGLVYDSGEGMWDNFQTTFDRIEYRLNLGHLAGAIAISKTYKGSVLGDDMDNVFYSAFVQYDNPESEIEAGIMYERQTRTDSQNGVINGPTPANPYYFPYPENTAGPQAQGALKSTTAAYGPPPISQGVPFPSNNNFVDAYFRKTEGYFSFGGEISWITGNSFDYNSDGAPDQLNALGFMGNVTYEYHGFKAFLEFLYASGDSNTTAGHLYGFVLLNRNRSPGLILGQELLGPYSTNNVAEGNLNYYGDPTVFSGAYYLRPGIRMEWSPSIASGVEAIIARKAAVGSDDPNLGVEIDLGTQVSVYKNFDIGVTLGYLFAGNGLRAPNPTNAFGVRGSGGIRF